MFIWQRFPIRRVKFKNLQTLFQTRPANKAGFLIHSEIHKARPDVHAVCHAHTDAGRAWSAFAKPLEMLNQDICNFYGCLAVDDEYGGIVFGEDEGKRIAKALGENSKVSTLDLLPSRRLGFNNDVAIFQGGRCRHKDDLPCLDRG